LGCGAGDPAGGVAGSGFDGMWLAMLLFHTEVDMVSVFVLGWAWAAFNACFCLANSKSVSGSLIRFMINSSAFSID
jgi:hypothetical protein